MFVVPCENRPQPQRPRSALLPDTVPPVPWWGWPLLVVAVVAAALATLALWAAMAVRDGWQRVRRGIGVSKW